MPKRHCKIYWTEHVKIKMRQYGLSKNKLLGLLYKPERKEKGIVMGTIALMQTKKVYSRPKEVLVAKKTLQPGSGQVKKIPGEIWLMYKDSKDLRKIISAWRYPGISKPGESIPVPQDIHQELLRNNC